MIVRALSGKSVIVLALTLAFASARTEVGRRCDAIFYCRALPCTRRNASRHYTLSHAREGEHAADHLRSSAAQECAKQRQMRRSHRTECDSRDQERRRSRTLWAIFRFRKALPEMLGGDAKQLAHCRTRRVEGRRSRTLRTLADTAQRRKRGRRCEL